MKNEDDDPRIRKACKNRQDTDRLSPDIAESQNAQFIAAVDINGSAHNTESKCKKECSEEEPSLNEPLLSNTEGKNGPEKTELQPTSSSKKNDVLGNASVAVEISTVPDQPTNGDGLRLRREKSVFNEQVSGDNSSYNERKEAGALPERRLIFGLVDTPPMHYLFFFAIQQACLAITMPLSTTAIVAQAVCAEKDLDLKVKIMSSTMIMMGLSTFLMCTVGVKLPIFQGPSPGYIIPLIIMMSLENFACPETFWMTDTQTNSSVLMAVLSGNSSEVLSRSALSSISNTSESLLATASNALLGDSSPSTIVPNRDVVLGRIQAYSGSLMVAGALHFLLGLTGLLGVVARYVGPVTIVPVMLLFGIYIHTVVVMFSETNWTVAGITAGICIVLGLFLADRKTPLLVWTPSKGFRVEWTYLHQIFALLIALIIGWMISYFMTISGALSDDPKSVEYNARTDARHQVIAQTSWLMFPYPGQFGAPGFSSTALISFLISTIISVLDSLGDYYATARAVRAPPPPSYALNRGAAVEGAMSFLSGCLGCGHATVSYSENIGAIGLSRVASRSVFQVVGAIYVALAVLGKVAAVFVSIPDAVIGGSQIVTFGMLIGVILSYLQVVDLKTSRNVSIIGITLLLGMMLPYWIKKAPPGTINTGYPSIDNAITVCLSNPPFLGGIFAFVLDNLVPGSLNERGIVVTGGASGTYVSADKLFPNDDLRLVDSSVEKRSAAQVADNEIKILEDEDTEVTYDRFDVSDNVYRIEWIPNCMRKGLFAKLFPIFDRGLDI